MSQYMVAHLRDRLMHASLKIRELEKEIAHLKTKLCKCPPVDNTAALDAEGVDLAEVKITQNQEKDILEAWGKHYDSQRLANLDQQQWEDEGGQ